MVISIWDVQKGGESLDQVSDYKYFKNSSACSHCMDVCFLMLKRVFFMKTFAHDGVKNSPFKMRQFLRHLSVAWSLYSVLRSKIRWPNFEAICLNQKTDGVMQTVYPANSYWKKRTVFMKFVAMSSKVVLATCFWNPCFLRFQHLNSDSDSDSYIWH
jgi:hypothetical protein